MNTAGSLHAGGSVWGDSAVTDNNGPLLILDELKEVDPKRAGATIAQMLSHASNAKGKRRALSQNPVAALAHADALGAE